MPSANRPHPRRRRTRLPIARHGAVASSCPDGHAVRPMSMIWRSHKEDGSAFEREVEGTSVAATSSTPEPRADTGDALLVSISVNIMINCGRAHRHAGHLRTNTRRARGRASIVQVKLPTVGRHEATRFLGRRIAP